MAVTRGIYFREYNIDENTIKNVFSSFQQVFSTVSGLYIFNNGSWELFSGEIVIKSGGYWWNITKGTRTPIEQIEFNLDSLLVEDEYDTVLSETDYDQILY